MKTLITVAVTAAVLVTVSSEASAKSPVRGGKTVTIRVEKKRERGVQLSYQTKGWAVSLELPRDNSACTVDLTDVTPKTFATRSREALSHRAPHEGILLSSDQYVAGHAYRLTLRCAERVISNGLVYLAPPAFKKRRDISIDEREARGDASDEIAMVHKGSL